MKRPDETRSSTRTGGGDLRGVIRRASAADAPRMHRLLVEMAASLGDVGKLTSTVDDLRRHASGEHPAYHGLLAERDGAAVGMALYFFNFSTWRGRLGVYVQDVYVAEDERGSGLARALLAGAAAHGREAGCSHLRLRVEPANSRARAFYARLGLAQRDDEIVYQVSDSAFHVLAGGA